MSKSTITLTPVPAGAVVLTEGDQDELIFIVEGGLLELERDGTTVGVVGAGGLVGAAGVVLDAPQLFTVQGRDRASFAKKMVVASLDDVLSEPGMFGRFLIALEEETSLVRALVTAKDENSNPSDLVNEAIQVRSEALGGLISADEAMSLAEGLGAARPAELDDAASNWAQLTHAAAVRALDDVRKVREASDSVAAGMQVLKERASVLAGLCSRL